jgi:hypothetical protein
MKEVIPLASAGKDVDSRLKVVSFDGVRLWINYPVVGDFVGGVEFELVGLVDGNAGGREDFNAKIGWDGDAVTFDEMQARLGDKENVGTTDIVVAKDRVNVAYQCAKIVLMDVDTQNDPKLCVGVGMGKRRAGAHADFSVNEFEANAGWIFAEHHELLGGHSRSAVGRFDLIQNRHFTPRHTL